MLVEHPLAWLDPLWLRFHGLRRPPSATVDDAVAVLAELGDPARGRDAGSGRRRPGSDAAWVTRRLCLPAGADGRTWPRRSWSCRRGLGRSPRLTWRSVSRRVVRWAVRGAGGA